MPKVQIAKSQIIKLSQLQDLVKHKEITSNEFIILDRYLVCTWVDSWFGIFYIKENADKVLCVHSLPDCFVIPVTDTNQVDLLSSPLQSIAERT